MIGKEIVDVMADLYELGERPLLGEVPDGQHPDRDPGVWQNTFGHLDSPFRALPFVG